jgi:ADP-ribose pyrophosphatase YjhB (NUDIX family)
MAVICVSTVVEKQGQYLMLQEGKNNHGQRGTWNFPAGKVELGEDLISASVREVLEETGYHVGIDGLLRIQKRDSADGRMSVTFFFRGHPIDEVRLLAEPGTMEVAWIPLKKISDLPLRFPDLPDLATARVAGGAANLKLLTYLGDV